MANFTITGAIIVGNGVGGVDVSAGFRVDGTSLASEILYGMASNSVLGDTDSVSNVTGLFPIAAVVGGEVSVPAVIYGMAYSAIQDGVYGTPVISGGVSANRLFTLGDASSFPLLVGLIRFTTIITGYVNPAAVVTGAVTSASVGLDPIVGGTILVTGSLRLSPKISGTIGVVSELTSALIRDSSVSSNIEAEYEKTGVRSSFPATVYTVTAKVSADLTVVPDNAHFVVAGSYVGFPGDAFFEQGGGPNYIGQRVVPFYGSTTLAFRPPVPNEVVWLVPSEEMLRYELNRESGQYGWRGYKTLPERHLDGQYVFNIFDPDKIYNYYGKLWGAVMWKWSYDTGVLLDQLNPDKASRFFLPLLAAQWGLGLNFDDTLNVRRSKTKSAVSAFKFRGQPQSSVLRLRALGYTGYVNEVWINPGDATAKLRQTNGGAAYNLALRTTGVFIDTVGFKGGRGVVGAYGYIKFSENITPSDGETVTITDGALTKIFEFDSNASVAIGNIAVVITGTPTALMTSLINAIVSSGLAITGTNVTSANFQSSVLNTAGDPSSTARGAGTDFIEYPHGYSSDGVEVYLPSSRVAVHLNDIQGNPIEITATIKSRVSSELRRDCLPVHIDIRYFDTDYSVLGAGSSENITVGDVLTIVAI